MDFIRESVLQANVLCDELDDQDPRKVIDHDEYTGTCFRVNPEFLAKVPFYNPDNIYFLTNFHVVDDANNRTLFMRTAQMGKSMFTTMVEAVVPKLDIAVLSISPNTVHDRWFSSEVTPHEVLENITELKLHKKRITNKTRKVSTIGFPQGLQNQLSSGWLAGRGSDEEDLLELNLSLNSGNSGGPLFDDKYRVIGICCSTLNEAEAISFAVPAFCVLKYFQNFYSTPYGRFPMFGIKLRPMTPAYKAVHDISEEGAVVHSVHPLSAFYKKIKQGDVIHSINDRKLDCFGLIDDSTRDCKITMNTTEFIVGLTKCSIRVSTKSNIRTVEQMPRPIQYKVCDHYKEWCPLKVVECGPFIFTNLSKTSLAEESSMPLCTRLRLMDTVRNTKSVEEIVIITSIDPNSYVASYEYPKEYDRVISINRRKIKSMHHLAEAVEELGRLHRTRSAKYFSIKTSSGEMWFDLNKVLTKKRKRL